MNIPQFRNFNVEEPVFKDYSVSVLDYNVIGDGHVVNTTAFNNAVRDVNKQGGGHLIVPPGLYLTGPITLLSNVDLHLETGATILFTHNEEEYPLIRTDYEGSPRIRALSPINAFGQDNIAITGHGIIDGSGDKWRLVKRSKTTSGQWKALLKKSSYVVGEDNKQVWFPSKSSYEGHMNPDINVNEDDALLKAQKYFDYYRPVMLSLVNCTHVLLEDAVFRNSPAWNLHPLFCEHITIRNVYVQNPWNAQNGDGLDLESCRYAVIKGCIFDVGDDAICLKSGKNAEARLIKKPTENVIIEGCVVFHGHGGFVAGSEMSRGIKNVIVRNCSFQGTDIGIRFKSTLGRGGVVENIYFDGIFMTNISKHAICFTMSYDGAIEESKADPEDIPEFRNISINNSYVNNCTRFVSIDGINNKTIHDISISNMCVSSKEGIYIDRASDIKFEKITLGSGDNSIKPVDINVTAGDGYRLIMEDLK